MKRDELLYALNDIRADFIEEAAPIRRRPVRRLLIVAVAASLTLLLMGAGVIFGGSVQDWMDHRWFEENVRPLGEGQTALVDAMSQEIGMSKTVGGITVDVDSAIFEDRGFKILVRVRGRQFSTSEGMSFAAYSMELDPDPTVGMGHGRGWEFAGVDGDGSWLIFFWCYWDQEKRPEEPFVVRLSMTDLIISEEGVYQPGTWEFEFPLEVTGVPEPIALPDCTVIGHDPETGAKMELELRDLVLYSTGLTFEMLGDGDFEVTAILDDGSSITATLGVGDSRWWEVPVEPNQVTALRIGETIIPVNGE